MVKSLRCPVHLGTQQMYCFLERTWSESVDRGILKYPSFTPVFKFMSYHHSFKNSFSLPKENFFNKSPSSHVLLKVIICVSLSKAHLSYTVYQSCKCSVIDRHWVLISFFIWFMSLPCTLGISHSHKTKPYTLGAVRACLSEGMIPSSGVHKGVAPDHTQLVSQSAILHWISKNGMCVVSWIV